MRTSMKLGIMLAPVAFLAACGSGDIDTVSKGQELQDLQSAYQSRAITDKEYEEQKEQVLDK